VAKESGNTLEAKTDKEEVQTLTHKGDDDGYKKEGCEEVGYWLGRGKEGREKEGSEKEGSEKISGALRAGFTHESAANDDLRAPRLCVRSLVNADSNIDAWRSCFGVALSFRGYGRSRSNA